MKVKPIITPAEVLRRGGLCLATIPFTVIDVLFSSVYMGAGIARHASTFVFNVIARGLGKGNKGESFNALDALIIVVAGIPALAVGLLAFAFSATVSAAAAVLNCPVNCFTALRDAEIRTFVARVLPSTPVPHQKKLNHLIKTDYDAQLFALEVLNDTDTPVFVISQDYPNIRRPIDVANEPGFIDTLQTLTRGVEKGNYQLINCNYTQREILEFCEAQATPKTAVRFT